MMMPEARYYLFILLLICPVLGCPQKTPSRKQTLKKETPIALLAQPKPVNPVIVFRILFRTGAIDDPKGMEGLTQLTAQMMVKGGTKRWTYAQLQEMLFPMATGIHAQVDKEMTIFTGRVHKDHLKSYYTILLQMIRNPGFTAQDFNRLKENALNDITVRLRTNDNENLGKQSLSTFMYGPHHPYGHYTGGTVEGLKKITLKDVKKHYRKYFAVNRLLIGIAGGYPKGFPKKLQRDLAKLPKKVEPIPLLPNPPRIKGLNFLIVEKETRATAISMGFPLAINRSHPDFPALMLVASYFGEHRQFIGVLMNKMREERGLNYGDYAYAEHFEQEGHGNYALNNLARRQQYFSIWIRPVQHKHRLFAIRQALRELKKLVTEGISKEKLKHTQSFLLGYTKLWEQTLDRRLGYALDARFYGVANHLDRARTAIMKLTVKKVNRVIRKYLTHQNIKIAVITKDAKTLKERLLLGQPSPIKYASPKNPAILREDHAISIFKLPVKAEKIKVVQLEKMFQR